MADTNFSSAYGLSAFQVLALCQQTYGAQLTFTPLKRLFITGGKGKPRKCFELVLTNDGNFVKEKSDLHGKRAYHSVCCLTQT